MITYKTILTKIIMIGIVLTSGQALGASYECQYSVDYDISIDKTTLSFKRDNHQVLFKGSQLEIDGTKAILTNEQKKASEVFQRIARESVPKVAEIAVEGTELGLAVANRVITSLFGDNDDVRLDLLEPINKVAKTIKNNISYETFNSKSLETSLNTEVDQELEKFMANAIGKYSAQFAGNLLSAVFSNDSEEMEDLEFRMENLEHDIESYIESNIDGIEEKAEELCETLEKLSKFDEVLEGVDGYPTLGIIQQEKGSGLNFTGRNLR